MKNILIFLLFSFSCLANLQKAPPAFNYQNSKAIYVDFITADYKLAYDFNLKNLTVTSTIKLDQPENGHIIFDLVPEIIEAKLNGEPIEISSIKSPENASSYRIVNRETSAGEHVLEIKNLVDRNLSYTNSGVSSAFWLSDLNDRRYLESYIPSNLEYDQVKMTFAIEFKNFPNEQIIFTNGKLVKLAKNSYIATYPEYYTSSSLYFHTSHDQRFDIINSVYHSIDGRQIPVTVYRSKGENLNSFMTASLRILAELEEDYGPFPHPQVIVYGAGMGGMEYCGATMTEMRALGHELHHSYFARGIMPARGNSGWVDEAIASWRDNGYPSRATTGFRSTQMAGHSIYRRYTDQNAYSRGAKFMAYLDYQLKSNGGLKKFLKIFKDEWLFTPFFTEDFQRSLESFAGRNFETEFNQYVYGRNGYEKLTKPVENPYHPSLSDKYLETLL